MFQYDGCFHVSPILCLYMFLWTASSASSWGRVFAASVCPIYAPQASSRTFHLLLLAGLVFVLRKLIMYPQCRLPPLHQHVGVHSLVIVLQFPFFFDSNHRRVRNCSNCLIRCPLVRILQVREVWEYNLDDEFDIIRYSLPLVVC